MLFTAAHTCNLLALTLGLSVDPLMVSEASVVPADQLERNTLSIGLLHERFRVLETRLSSLDERFSGLSSLPEGQLERHAVATDFLLGRAHSLEDRVTSLGEGVAGLASLCGDWEARLSRLESSLVLLSSQVALFDSKQQAFEHSFSRRVEEEFLEALSALHLRIDILCRQRADLGAQFCHLSRRLDLLAGIAETTDSEFSLHTLD